MPPLKAAIFPQSGCAQTYPESMTWRCQAFLGLDIAYAIMYIFTFNFTTCQYIIYNEDLCVICHILQIKAHEKVHSVIAEHSEYPYSSEPSHSLIRNSAVRWYIQQHALILYSDNEGSCLTVRMRRLVCAFVIRTCAEGRSLFFTTYISYSWPLVKSVWCHFRSRDQLLEVILPCSLPLSFFRSKYLRKKKKKKKKM